jgi:hypothetical protein
MRRDPAKLGGALMPINAANKVNISMRRDQLTKGGTQRSWEDALGLYAESKKKTEAGRSPDAYKRSQSYFELIYAEIR